ncbi:MAG: hypothetical protein HC853_00865 [Anaerolineae bacterium]|nr:hypothetical protein [Anaerolineae bacterium]
MPGNSHIKNSGFDEFSPLQRIFAGKGKRENFSGMGGAGTGVIVGCEHAASTTSTAQNKAFRYIFMVCDQKH